MILNKSNPNLGIVAVCCILGTICFACGFVNPIHFLYSAGCFALAWAFWNDPLND